jgi:hypothetical protein
MLEAADDLGGSDWGGDGEGRGQRKRRRDELLTQELQPKPDWSS